jgi:chorismate dehydratase
MPTPYRLGVPRYANTAPLYHYLKEGSELRFSYGVPTELNQWVLEGQVDLSLVSSYFYLQHADKLKPLPDFSVADLGPVYSVNLFHNKPWNELKTVALTTESATSVELLKYLIKLDGLEVEYSRKAGGLELLKQFDGVLLIGDGAIQSYTKLFPVLPESVHQVPKRFGETQVTDLSMKWFERTRLPFVFAVWVTRKDEAPPPGIVRQLRAARQKGLGNLEKVARTEANRLGIAIRLMQHYLFNFRYHLEAPDRLGLQAFAEAVGLSYPDEYWEV